MTAQSPLRVLVLLDGPTVYCAGLGVIKALALSDLPLDVFVAATSDDIAGAYLVENRVISPALDDPGYIDWICQYCRSNRIDVVMPDGADFPFIADFRDTISKEGGAQVLVQPDHVLKIAEDKLAACEWLSQQGFGHPPHAPAEDEEAVMALFREVGFPLISKPNSGRASIGVMRVETERQLHAAMELPDTVIQQEVGTADSEYTANCFVSRSGEALGVFVMRRELWSGTSIRCEVDRRPDLVEAASDIATRIGARGSINIQFRIHEGVPICLEINARFSGTTAIRASLGFNDVDYALRHYVLGEELGPLPVVEEGRALRMFTEVYL